MGIALNLPDNKKQKIGFSVLDEDGQPFAVLPDGVTDEYVSDNEAASTFVKDATPVDGPNGEKYTVTGDITTGKANTNAAITASFTFPDGKVISDQILVAVGNSNANSLGIATIGDPTSDAPPAP
jgi:hypothetical protein